MAQIQIRVRVRTANVVFVIVANIFAAFGKFISAFVEIDFDYFSFRLQSKNVIIRSLLHRLREYERQKIGKPSTNPQLSIFISHSFL